MQINFPDNFIICLLFSTVKNNFFLILLFWVGIYPQCVTSLVADYGYDEYNYIVLKIEEYYEHQQDIKRHKRCGGL